jgi:acylaminoacyl-peptidase
MGRAGFHFCLIFWALVGAPAGARPFTAMDLATMDRASAPRLSPDARHVAFNVRATDWQGNRGLNALLLQDLGGAREPVMIVSGERGATSPRWSPDGRWLYFLSSQSGSQQLWRIGADGGSRRQMTAFPLDVGIFRISADGRSLVFSADAYADCPTLACTKARDEEKAKQKGSGIRVSGGNARFWDTFEDQKFVGLFAASLAGAGSPAEATPLLRDFPVDVPDRIAGDDNSFAVSPDGRNVYFSSRDPAKPLGSETPYRIYVVPADGSARPRPLFPNAAASHVRPALSPDGRRLAFLASEGSVWTYARTGFMIHELGSGRTRQLAPALDVMTGRIAWSTDGRSLLTAPEMEGQSPLLAIDAASGAVRRLTEGGTVSDFDSASGAIVYLRESLVSPQQVYVVEGSAAPRQVTRIAAPMLAEVELGAPDRFSFRGWNEEMVHGYVVKPHGFQPGRKYPVAFLVHGGPHTSFGDQWSYRWNPQVWAGLGYAVVMVDFHGSSGYGEAFGKSIVGHWGDRPLEDLQKGWAHALSRYDFLDGNRACALGASYGGYMIAWMASQWSEPWKCLVNHAGLFDTESAAWSIDFPAFTEAQYGGWTQTDDVQRFNPAAHIDRWTKPMLVIHGGRDYRVPSDQGIAAYNAARLRKVPTELLWFPDENHWILKPQNLVQWFAAKEAWLDRWTGSE